MRLAMRLHDRDFDEKESEEREDGGLHKAHKELKHHDRHRADEGYEMLYNED